MSVSSLLEKQVKSTQRKIDKFTKRDIPKATARALNRVAMTASKKAIKSVARKEKIPVKTIKGRARLVRATAYKLFAIIKVNRMNMPIIRLTEGKKAAQAVTRGMRKGSLKVGNRYVPGGFVQTLKNGRTHVLVRRGKERYPIDVVKISLKKQLTEAFHREAEYAMKHDMAKEIRAELKNQIRMINAK
ncbi:phage tail protein [Pasteurellaceae bacterium TAE3-ERU1]|nr:phage tail protein [Pasteurellaceae bacterium TAE3-ERU1]